MSDSPFAPPPLRAPPADGMSGLMARTLLSVARQRRELDEPRCRIVIEFMNAAMRLRSALHATLAAEGLSELRFFALVVLFALDPEPTNAADLAAYTGATRSSITDVVDQLQAAGLALRERDTADRRIIYVRLTEAGRAAADHSAVAFLRAAAGLARRVDGQSAADAQRLCAQLLEGISAFAVP